MRRSEVCTATAMKAEMAKVREIRHDGRGGTTASPVFSLAAICPSVRNRPVVVARLSPLVISGPAITISGLLTT